MFPFEKSLEQRLSFSIPPCVFLSQEHEPKKKLKQKAEAFPDQEEAEEEDGEEEVEEEVSAEIVDLPDEDMFAGAF